MCKVSPEELEITKEMYVSAKGALEQDLLRRLFPSPVARGPSNDFIHDLVEDMRNSFPDDKAEHFHKYEKFFSFGFDKWIDMWMFQPAVYAKAVQAWKKRWLG